MNLGSEEDDDGDDDDDRSPPFSSMCASFLDSSHHADHPDPELTTSSGLGFQVFTLQLASSHTLVMKNS